MPIVKDRLAEFKSHLPPPSTPETEIPSEDVVDADEETDHTLYEEEEEDEDMKVFYDEVAIIKQGLLRFEQNIASLDKAWTEQIAMGKGKPSDCISSLLSENSQLASILRNKLKAMKEHINSLDKENPTANIRIRVNIQQTLTKRFLDLMQQYQENQLAYEGNYRKKVRRQIVNIFPNKTHEEIDHMIEKEDIGNLLQSHVIEDKRKHSEAAMALVHLKEQHRDIMQLEQNILELHQIFVDISTLIDTQDPLVNQIEWNVEQATAWTGEAVGELKRGCEYEKKRRARCCACCMTAGGAVCAACAGAAGYLAFTLAPLALCSVM